MFNIIARAMSACFRVSENQHDHIIDLISSFFLLSPRMGISFPSAYDL